MPNEPPPNDMRSLWQGQRTEPVTMSLDELRKKARKYQRKIGRRNALEYAAAVLVVVFFGYTIWRVHDMFMRVGGGLCIAGMVYMASQLHKRGSAKSVPGDMALTTCLDFHRRELERQRDLLRSSWSWYLGPMIPGLVVIILGGIMANPGRLQHPRLFVAAYAGLCALAFFWVRQLHKRYVRRLQRQIDELFAVERQS
jgi:hypothetical protein